jgi:putative ABC transport system permease protein
MIGNSSTRLLLDLLNLSVRLVHRNRRRYNSIVVTIAAGIAGLLVVINIGDSVEKKMGEHLTLLGRSTIIDLEIVDDNSDHPADFTAKDVARLKMIPHVTEVAPYVYSSEMKARFYEQRMIIWVAGVDHSFWNTIMATVLSGSLTHIGHEENRAMVCVLGTKLVDGLFSGLNPVGKRISIGGVSCRVIGTLGGIQDLKTRRTAFIPLTTARHRFEGMHEIKDIRVRVDHWNNVKAVVDKVWETLGTPHDVKVRNVRVHYYPERINKVRSSVAMVRFLALLGLSVTVMIGGAGITTLMLSAVRERRSEIGLKKALGSAEPLILVQFLMESVIVSFKGGIIGLISGTLTCAILQSILDLKIYPLVFALSILIGFAGAVPLGIASGIYPAIRASHLDPVVAMRGD